MIFTHVRGRVLWPPSDTDGERRKMLESYLSRPLAWRLIDGAIGMMMAAIALKLATGQGFPGA